MNLPKIPENFFNVSENKNILTEDDEINTTIKVALDSVWVIDNELSKEYFTQDSYNTLKGNADHLEIVLNYENIKNSNKDLTPLRSAIDRAKQALILLENRTTEYDIQTVDNFIENVLNEQSR